MLQSAYKNLRQKVIENLGGKCQDCGTTEKLQLHHRYYAKDSIRPKVHNEAGNQTVRRVKEAIAHPERFSLLCLSCHNRKEPRLPNLKPRVPPVIFETVRGGDRR